MILHILEIIFGCGCMAALFGWLVLDVRESIKPAPLQEPPTKIDKLIKAYMKRDSLDPTSTINFLMEVDGLEDPFAEAPMLPPPKPSDAATSARPPRARKGPAYNIMDDLVRAYSVNSHYMGSEPSELDHIQHMVVSGLMTQDEGRRHLERNMAQCGCAKCKGGGVIHPMDEPYPVQNMRPPLPAATIRG